MAPFILTPCTTDDLPSMVSLYIRAFTGTHVTSYLFPEATCTRAALSIWLHTRFGRLLAGTKPGVRHFKITDAESGQLIAWARWGYPPSELSGDERAQWEAERQKEKQEAERQENTPEIPSPDDSTRAAALASAASDRWPSGANEQLCEAYFSALDRARERHVRAGDDYLLYFLATDPACQGRGLGTMLLRHGIAAADARGRRVYLEATEEGRPLYEKLGWRTVDLVSVDFAPWGAERPGVNWVMIREARKGTGIVSWGDDGDGGGGCSG